MDSPTGNLCVRYRTIPLLVPVFLLLSFSALHAQVKEIRSLGAVQTFELPVNVSHPQLFRFSSSKAPDLLWYDKDSLMFFSMRSAGDGRFSSPTMLVRSTSVTSFQTGNVNDDGLDDLIVVHRDQNQIELFVSRRNDSSYSSSFFTVNFYPERAVIGDINNDRIPDVMTFGKLSSGVSVLQGKGGGKFHPAKTIFENIPVNDLSLITLNGDNIIDAAVHNWLTNETVIFLGTGRMRFSEQTVLSFGEDSVHVQFIDANNDRMTDVAISSAKDRTLQILQGDGLGNFSFSSAMPIYTIPSAVMKGSFSSPGSTDLLLASPHNEIFTVLIQAPKGKYYDEIVYGMRDGSSEIVISDLNGDRLNDVFLLHSSGRSYDIVWNTQTSLKREGQEVSFSAGRFPTNVSVIDLNSDGRDDIVICNERSSSVSLLISSPTTFFSGQISVETPEDPVSVSLYAKTDSSVILYTMHQKDPKISLITLKKDADTLSALTGDLEQFSITLPDKPITVLPDVSYMEKGISLYAFMSSATNSIMFYQQVKGTRFLSKSLVPLIPSKIIYSTISDLNSDGKTDLMYVYSDDQIRSTMFGITMNDSTGNFRGKPFSTEISDSSNKRAIVVSDDFNGDQIKDILVYTSPENRLRLALGLKESLYGPFEDVAAAFLIRSPEQLQQFDFDNDGNLDILYHDRTSEELMLHRGKGNGTFFPPIRIASIPKESVFRCGDFNGDSNTDVVYTNPIAAAITVIYGN